MLVVPMVAASAISWQNCKRQELLLNTVTLSAFFWPAMLLAFKAAPGAPFRPLLCLTVQCSVCKDNDYFEKKKFNQTCCGI